jgi:hypothetical protein
MLNIRAPPDYKEKDSNKFKVADKLYPDGCYNYEIEGFNFDYLSDVSSPDVIPRHRGRLLRSQIIAEIRGFSNGVNS